MRHALAGIEPNAIIENVTAPRSRLLPVIAGLIVGAIVVDVARRALQPEPSAPAPASDTTTIGGGAAATPSSDAAADAARRSARTRERLQLEDSAASYVVSTVRDADSSVRRWSDERIRTPLKVAVMRQAGVEGFREEFVSNVLWAVHRWNGVVPVFLETGADSASADIVVVWAERLDSSRTGRTDLTWDRRGWVHHALIVLATHTPDGRPLDNQRVSALALHEIGHAIGLNHSPRRDDVLHPIAYASELSERDRRTARVLYELPTGSIR